MNFPDFYEYETGLLASDMYLTSSTADVWYDVIGTFYIYDNHTKRFLVSYTIKDNSDKFKELAIFLFELIHSDNYFVLEQFNTENDLFHYVNNKLILLEKAKINFDDMEDYLIYDEDTLDWNKVDTSNSKLNIKKCFKDIPKYFTVADGGWWFDEYYIFINDEPIYHAINFDPYSEEEIITKTRVKFLNSLQSDNKVKVLEPVRDLYSYNNDVLNKIIK